MNNETLIYRLRKRAEIRRSIPRGEPDRISELLEETATYIEQLEKDYVDLYQDNLDLKVKYDYLTSNE